MSIVDIGWEHKILVFLNKNKARSTFERLFTKVGGNTPEGTLAVGQALDRLLKQGKIVKR